MKSLLTPAFVAKVHTELKKSGASMHSVARKMNCSPSTIYRATGGKECLLAGKTTAFVEKARRERTKRANAQRAKAKAKSKPHGNTKRKVRAA